MMHDAGYKIKDKNMNRASWLMHHGLCILHRASCIVTEEALLLLS